MAIIYKSKRVGQHGRVFNLYKFRTLKTDMIGSFALETHYTMFGRFLRKTKLDELPQLINVLKGDIKIFGYRPEEEKTWQILPADVREVLSKHKPGIIDLSSLHFFDEEKILQVVPYNSHQTYWEKIRPMKLTLQCFYLENRCFLLNLAIIWIVFKKILWSITKK